MIWGRKDLRIDVSEAERDAEGDLEVHFAVALQKRNKNLENLFLARNILPISFRHGNNGIRLKRVLSSVAPIRDLCVGCTVVQNFEKVSKSQVTFRKRNVRYEKRALWSGSYVTLHRLP